MKGSMGPEGLNRGDFAVQGHLAMSGDICSGHSGGGGMLLAPCG